MSGGVLFRILIAAIRELLEEPLATVSYPINRSGNTDNGFLASGYGFGRPYINILSVVQTLEDFEVNEDTGQATVTAPSGDIIILDEFHNLGKRRYLTKKTERYHD